MMSKLSFDGNNEQICQSNSEIIVILCAYDSLSP